MITLLLALALLAFSLLLLGVRVFFTKGGKFPSGHAHEVLSRYEKMNKK